MFFCFKNKYACVIKSYLQNIYLPNENVYILHFKTIIDNNKPNRSVCFFYD